MRKGSENFPAGVKPQIDAILSPKAGSGSMINLSNSDFVSESLKFREGTSETGEITVGGVIMTGCSFSLWNDTGKFNNFNWENSHIDISLISGEEVANFGSFFIVSHKTRGNTIAVEAYNAVKIMDEHKLGEVGLSYPIDAAAAAIQIANYGMEEFSNFEITGLENASGITLQDPGDPDMTNRDALSYIAQALGKYALMTWNSEKGNYVLNFGWYDTSTAYDVGTTFSHDLQTKDITVTGVTVVAYDTDDNGNDIMETRGTDGYKLAIGDNPFITAENISAVADRINTAVGGLTFRPGTFAIAGTAKILAGDAIKISTHEEQDVVTLATNITYTPSKVQEQIAADAEEAVGDLRVSTKSYIKRVAKKTVDESTKGGGGSGSDITVAHGEFKKGSAGTTGLSVGAGQFTYTMNNVKDTNSDVRPGYRAFALQGYVTITAKANISANSYIDITTDNIKSSKEIVAHSNQHFVSLCYCSKSGPQSISGKTYDSKAYIYVTRSQSEFKFRITFPEEIELGDICTSMNITVPVFITG